VNPAGTSCSITFPAVIPAGSLVCVSALSSCGLASSQRCKGISSGLPGTPGNILGQTTGLCNNNGVSFTVAIPSSRANSYAWSITGGATIVPPNNLSGVSINFPSNFLSGTITVHGVNSCGDGGDRSLSVRGAPSVPAPITGNASPCAGGIETYTTIGSTGATEYNWNVPVDATILSNPPYGASILVQIGNNNGVITASAVNSCGSSSNTSFNYTITCRQSQMSSSISNIVNVYPNPTGGNITINFSASEDGNVLMNVTDLAGRIVLTENMKAVAGTNIHETDLAQLAKGIYLLHLNGDRMNEVVKVTVE
ncbi:MAG: T9SS type A sorting domain-containing protein, partial [Bacteroidota bacterium]